MWNYLDLSSYTLMAVVFVLHLTRANNQLFRILVALQALLLCMRSLYFLLAIEHLGSLVRMVVQVGGRALATARPVDPAPLLALLISPWQCCTSACACAHSLERAPRHRLPPCRSSAT